MGKHLSRASAMSHRSAAGSSRAEISGLPNLGPKSQQMLAQAGITTLAQLRCLGAVAAYRRVKQAEGNASLNLLWALEGAISDLPWKTVAREHRASLLLALEADENA